jgi:predicted GNAT family acetyltransferase
MAIHGIEITHEGNEAHGEYRAIVPGSNEVGRLTWRARGEARVADQTIEPAEISGQGAADARVDARDHDAREQGFTIVPQCSYVDAQFRRHPEWADLLAATPS